jgi:hypothetical protein
MMYATMLPEAARAASISGEGARRRTLTYNATLGLLV